MTETTDQAMPQRNIAEWAAFQHFQDINKILQKLTPLNWTAHPDPESEGLYYIGGPPDTNVVAEGLKQEDAESIVTLINELPEAIEYFEDLAKLWDVAVDLGDDGEEIDYEVIFPTITEVVNKYQLRIAQLEANPAPVPEVAVASDLTYMHVGHLLQVPALDRGSLPIVGVKQSGDFVEVSCAMGKDTIILLHKDTPVEVQILGPLADMGVKEESPETVAEEETPEVVTPTPPPVEVV